MYPSTFKNHSYGKFDFIESNGPDSLLKQADYTLWARNGQLTLLKLDSEALRDSVIATFQKNKQHGIWSAAQAQEHLKTIGKL